MVELKKIRDMYDYLSSETPVLSQADGAFVFGRADPLVAKRAAEVCKQGLVNYIMVTGGIGKDSGVLKKWNMPESYYLGALLIGAHSIPESRLYLESKAKNARENSDLGMDTIEANNLPHENLIVVAHATSLRRLEAVLGNAAQERNFQTKLQKTKTRYDFNPGNPKDQKETVEELLRLADWPSKHWCLAQEDLPQDLVEYARAVKPSLQQF